MSSTSAAESKPLCPMVENILKVFHSDEWKLKGTTDGVEFYTRKMDWSDNKACMFKTFIPGATPAHADAIINGPDGIHVRGESPEANAYKFEGLLDTRRVVRQREAEDGTLVDLHSKLKSPFFMVTARDTAVTCRTSWYLSAEDQARFGLVPAKDDTKKGEEEVIEPCVWVQAGRDIEKEEEKVPEEKDYVRLTCHGFGFIAQRVPGGLKLHFLMAVDPNGSIPLRVVAATNDKQGEGLAGARKLILESLESS